LFAPGRYGMTVNAKETPGLYGVYAVNKLLGSAQLDRRLTPSDRGALAIVSGYSDNEGTFMVSLSSTLSERCGKSRQALQKSMRKLEKCGYLSSERRFHPTGAERSKAYMFNLSLEGTDACPIVWNDAASDDTMSRLDDHQAKGVQPPEVAGGATARDCGGCNRQRLHIRNHLKKPVLKKPAPALGDRLVLVSKVENVVRTMLGIRAIKKAGCSLSHSLSPEERRRHHPATG